MLLVSLVEIVQVILKKNNYKILFHFAHQRTPPPPPLSSKDQVYFDINIHVFCTKSSTLNKIHEPLQLSDTKKKYM